MLEIGQSQNDIRSHFIYEELHAYIDDEADCHTGHDIQSRYLVIDILFHPSIAIESKEIDRISKDECISQYRDPVGPESASLHPGEQ